MVSYCNGQARGPLHALGISPDDADLPTLYVVGLGVGTVWTNTDMLVTRITGDRQLGAAVGAAQSFKEVGDMLGPLAIGAIAQAWGVRVGFVVCGVAALAVVALFAVLRPRMKPPA
jgi:MFS family permease